MFSSSYWTQLSSHKKERKRERKPLVSIMNTDIETFHTGFWIWENKMFKPVYSDILIRLQNKTWIHMSLHN